MGKAKATSAKATSAKAPAEEVKVGAMDASKVAGDPHADNAPVDEKPAKADKNSTVFVFKNGGSRTFSASVHGKGWEDSADEFAETNKAIIASRDGKAL